MTERGAYLMRKYGITEADYLAIFERQNGTCALCGRPPKNVRLNVDHRHGQKDKRHSVRGLLCAGRMGCNRKLGRVDDREWLKAALRYLMHPPAREVLK